VLNSRTLGNRDPNRHGILATTPERFSGWSRPSSVHCDGQLPRLGTGFSLCQRLFAVPSAGLRKAETNVGTYVAEASGRDGREQSIKLSLQACRI